MAATAERSYRDLQLVGEIVRDPEARDHWCFYPFVRPAGQSVGFVYRTTSHGSHQNVAVYDQAQAAPLGNYLFAGRYRCSCDRRKDYKPRKCWHLELVRERKAKEAGGEA